MLPPSPSPSPTPELTQRLLDQMQQGDTQAREQLLALLYDELRRIARIHLRAERSTHTLQPTALVNEAYLRIFDNGAQPVPPNRVNDRAHFLCLMSLSMRRVLVDHARARNAARRGGGQATISLADSNPAATGSDPIELLELDAALEDLALEKPHVARALEMHYFGGMTADEIATASESRSVHMIRQDLRFGQAWLRRRLAP
jgi:RNA polymerase sigma factor (TIGR02999 family)